MKLHTYLNEIFDIAAANNVSWDVGKDMFLANIRNCGSPDLPHYAGADDFDYAVLKRHADELAETGPAFVESVHDHYEQVVSLRKEKKFVEAIDVISH